MILWTKEVEDQLRRLWAEGHSAREIGVMLGVNRGCITGKVWRLGLKGREARVNALQVERRLKAREEAAKRPKPEPKARRRLPPALTLVTLQQINAGALNIGLLDLTPTMCRWPVTDARPILFCGHGRAGEHTPYCEAHAAASVIAALTEKMKKRSGSYQKYIVGLTRFERHAA